MCSRVRGVAASALVAMMLAGGSFAAAESRTVLRDHACTSCHLDREPTRYLYESFAAFRDAPPPAPTGCAQCHVSNAVATAQRPPGWLPLSADMIGRIRRFHAYVEAPPLTMTVELPGRERRRFPRFTACGLERFLASPLPRHGAAQQSMFPVAGPRRQALLEALAPELERCDAAAPSPDRVERGRALFLQLGCVACHTASGRGPRLRLGVPLLGRAYFGARVRHGTGTSEMPPIWQRSWTASNGNVVAMPDTTVAMPAYAALRDADVDALYAYASADRTDVPDIGPPAPHAPRSAVPDAIRQSLFREVQKRVFDTSCRHCHSPAQRDQALIQRVFGEVPGSAPVELPMTRLGVSPGPTLHRLLTPGPGCTDSPLLVRLRARAAEWAGQSVDGMPRGMPMTLLPLDRDALRLVEVWSAAGCPSDRGDLCTPCPPSGATR